jgi:hypothetical protein
VGGNPKTLTIPDARGNGASFRVTRHPAQKKIVLSQWRDGVCVASTPIELSEVPALIGIFADALGEAVVESVARTPEVWSAKRGLNRDRSESGEGRLGVGRAGQDRAAQDRAATGRTGTGRGRTARQGITPTSLRESSARAWATLQGRMRPAWAEITHLRPVTGAPSRADAAPTAPASGRPFPSGASG